jgi:hypothetical protein
LVGEALIASQHQSVPPEAATEFRKIRHEISAHGGAFEMNEGFDQEHEGVDDHTILALPNTSDDDVERDMPELTEEILARMFANMMEHGLAV